jgi:hypothetical protein
MVPISKACHYSEKTFYATKSKTITPTKYVCIQYSNKPNSINVTDTLHSLSYWNRAEPKLIGSTFNKLTPKK